MDIPKSIYRLQFGPSFTFKDAEKIVPYLAKLGIDAIYASPILKPASGSTHGYDVVDPTRLNPDLGTDEDFDRLTKLVQDHEMGWVQDIVPNHMAYHSENKMLMDVFEKGVNSVYYNTFDINWDNNYAGLKGKVLAPFLGGFYNEVLENGEIYVKYTESGFTINYYGICFPLKIETYSEILKHRLDELEKKLGKENSDYIKYLGILYVLENIKELEYDVEKYGTQIHFVKKMIWELYNKNEEIQTFIVDNINIFNGLKGNVDSFDLLDNLLGKQNFRLSFWKVGTEEINYRRFFYVNDLISLRIEDEKVFEDTHQLIFKFLDEEKITGIRLDHIDGLYDPTEYLQRLKKRIGDKYIVVEKILEVEGGEELPAFWPVQGSTGYDFMNALNGVLCKKDNKSKFEEVYRKFVKMPINYFELVYQKKKLIIEKHMTGDIDNLANYMKRITGNYRYGNDVTMHGLKRTLIEIIAFFETYRTYISHEIFSDNAREFIKTSIIKARKRNPDLALELDLFEWFFFIKHGTYINEDEKKEWIKFIMRFQQFTGPVMAKGIEDTAFYIYNKLTSLNEVGGNPEKFGVDAHEFHDFIENKTTVWPYSINSTSTHDVKRGEDVRARINVLSEIPDEWDAKLKKWSSINEKERLNGILVPTRNDEYFYYQTLIGTMPFEGVSPDYKERIKNYIEKAIREAKIHTEWLKPDTYYEEAYLEFIDKTLEDREDNEFLKDFIKFQKKVANIAVFNSTSQLIVKLNTPGVSDFYQGTELWELSLVDPDNRRSVDFELRKKYLNEILKTKSKDTLFQRLTKHKEDGKIKLYIMKEILDLKKEKSMLYQKGNYTPLEVKGKYRDNVMAFARTYRDEWVVVVVPRFTSELSKTSQMPVGEKIWGNTYIELPENIGGKSIDAVSKTELEFNQKVLISDIFGKYPGAVFTNTKN